MDKNTERIFLGAFGKFGFILQPSTPNRLVGWVQGKTAEVTLELYANTGTFTIELEQGYLRRTICCMQGYHTYDEIRSFIQRNRLLCIELGLPIY